MRIEGATEAIQKAMLDDSFIMAFANKLRRAMAGEPLHDVNDLEIFFDIDDSDPQAFVLRAENLYTEHPVLSFSDRDGTVREVDPVLVKQAIDTMIRLQLPDNHSYWAGIKLKEV